MAAFRTLSALLAVLVAGGFLLVTAPQSAAADSVISTYSGVGGASQRPSLALSADGSVLYVANGTASTVSVLDAASGAVLATIPTPGNANSLTLSPDGSKLYVGLNVGTNSDPDALVVIDTATRAIVGSSIAVGGDGTSGIAVTPNGSTLYVPIGNANLVDVIDTTTRAVTQLPNTVTQPRIPVLSPDGTHLYVSHFLSPVATEHITSYDLTASPVTAVDIPLPSLGSLDGMTMSPDGSHVYFTQRTATISRFGTVDTATNAVTMLDGIGGGARGVAVTPDGARAYVADFTDNTVAIIDLATNTLVSTVSVPGGPQDVVISPDGRFAYVSTSTVRSVARIAIDFAPSIVTTSLPAGTVGDAYSSTLVASGFPAPTFSVTGTLPPGLSIDPTTGALSGTPTTAGSYTFRVTATNTVRGVPASVDRDFTIVIRGIAVLAASGIDAVPPLIAGGAALLVGFLAVARGTRRARRSARS
jgi:YVTN family beta-propeller protein